jgi:toxin ParE1/3/4
MSSRSLPVKLSPKAHQDFIDILRYTGETWGPNQLQAYRDKLDEALQVIGRNPQLGHRGGDLPEDHRLYLIGAHVIVYRTEAASIGIIRILHQRMQLASHIPKG